VKDNNDKKNFLDIKIFKVEIFKDNSDNKKEQ